MSLEILKDVLVEELDRKHRAMRSFENVLNGISYCSKIYVKVIHGKDYAYVKVRDNSSSKPKERCIGNYEKISENLIQEIENQSQQWIMFNKQHKEVREDIVKLERMMKII